MALPRRDRRWGKEVTVLLLVIAVILVGFALRETYAIGVPLVCAFFLAALVYPMMRWVRRRLPQKLSFLSVLLSAVVLIAAPASIFGLFWLGSRLVGHKTMEYAQRFQRFWVQATAWGVQHDLPMQDGIKQGMAKLVDLTSAVLNSVWSLLGLVGLLALIFFLVLLMLLEVPNWHDKLMTALGQRQAERWSVTAEAIAKKMRDYMWFHTVISALSALTEGLWIWAMGVDFAFLWAIVIFVLSYIPRVGSVVAFVPPILVALIQHGLLWALLVLAGLTFIDSIIAYIVEPRLGARALKVSPVVMLLSLMVWGWIWGIAGAILAVPMTVTAIIICGSIPRLRPLAMLLGQFPDERSLREEITPPPQEGPKPERPPDSH